MNDPKKGFDWGDGVMLYIVLAPIVGLLWICLAPAGCTDNIADRGYTPSIGDGGQTFRGSGN